MVVLAVLTVFVSSRAVAEAPSFSADQLFDYEWKKVFHYTSLFDSLDGFSVTTHGEKAEASVDGTQLLLLTGAKPGSYSEVAKQPLWQGIITFSQKSNFRTTFVLTKVVNTEFYTGVGSYKNQGYGFKVTNSNLYGFTNDGKTEKTMLIQPAKGDIYTVEARYEPNRQVVFFVNSAQKGTITEILPGSAEVPNRDFLFMRLTTLDDTPKVLQTSYVEYLQARNVLK